MKNDNYNFVYSARRLTGVTPVVIPVGSSFARFISLRQMRGPKDAASHGIHNNRRLDVRHKKGRKMRTIEKIIGGIGRFAFGLGSALALVCVFGIVTSDHALDATQLARTAEIVRLDPVVVTISRERFAEIRAEEREGSMLARTRVRKPNEG